MRNRHVFANMLKKNKKVNIFIKRHKKDCYLVLFVVNLYTGVRPRINPGDFFIVQILCKKCAKLCQIVQKYDTKRKNLRFWFTNINNKKTADSRGFYLGSPNQIRTGVLALKGRCPGPLDDGAKTAGVFESIQSKTPANYNRHLNCCQVNIAG